MQNNHGHDIRGCRQRPRHNRSGSLLDSPSASPSQRSDEPQLVLTRQSLALYFFDARHEACIRWSRERSMPATSPTDGRRVTTGAATLAPSDISSGTSAAEVPADGGERFIVTLVGDIGDS